MSRTILNLTAICDKAGRPTNQDNFWICPDLSSYAVTGTVTIDSNTEVALGDKGTLLVVADGMGGMNAGEVASQIVVDSIKRTFSNLKSLLLSNSDAIKKFIKQAIVDADREMKKHAEIHPETIGMGSTIVLVWILDKKVYVGWCGDSRAYCYNAQNGLVRLTHDHSYVQELVDNNKLSEDDAFDHPDSNIITRSLGDSSEKANPDVKEYPLHTGDIFLLCSDGLCGLLRDGEIENIMAKNHNSIENCLNALWQYGSSIGWTDNTTIELAKVLEGGIKPTDTPIGYYIPKNKSNPISSSSSYVGRPEENNTIFKRSGIITAIAFVIGLLVGGFIIKTLLPSYPENVEDEIKSLKYENDSLRTVISNLGVNGNIRTDNNDQLEAERRAKEEAEAAAEKERKAKEEAERKVHQERAAKEEAERRAKAEEDARKAREGHGSGQITKVISQEYKEQIRKTQQDFVQLNALYQTIVRSRTIYPEEIKKMEEMLINMNKNLMNIEKNDSYEYLDENTKNAIKKLREETSKIEASLKKIRGANQQTIVIPAQTQNQNPSQTI